MFEQRLNLLLRLAPDGAIDQAMRKVRRQQLQKVVHVLAE